LVRLKHTVLPHFKIVFAKDHIISCAKTDQVLARNTPYHVEHNKGQVIHAIVKAPSMEKAKAVASEVLQHMMQQSKPDPAQGPA
jgi:hypothetical protein